MVTFAKVPNEDIVLVLDPTNAGVGVLLDGRGRMFNGSAEVVYNLPYTYFFNDTTMDINLTKLVALSYKCPYTYKELEKALGLEVQKEVKLGL